MFTISSQQLKTAAPRCPRPDAWADALNEGMLLYGIAQDVDYVVEFLAQCAHESADFTRLEEGLWYTADRLMAVWPSRFPNLAKAVEYAGKPQALAEFVYGGRMGNGPPGSGDGWNYRGRGPIMITGKDAYKRMAKAINDPLLVTCPDRLRTIRTGALVACAWWAANPELNKLADDLPNDDDQADFISITRKVNGGTVGLAHRAQLRAAFRAALVA
jgi:putative chitinase